MYRVYIIAGRQANPARALASSAFGWVSNWTHLTQAVMRDQRGTGEKKVKYSLENGKSTPSRRNYVAIARLPFSLTQSSFLLVRRTEMLPAN